jgi:septal ring factor EnvC (AmiA/AmiB activator)
MAEPTDPQEATPSPDNTHWGVAYLREDLQDLRQQMREDSKDLRQQIAETNRRIDETNRRIDRTNELIGSRFAWLITTMVALAGILAALIKL